MDIHRDRKIHIYGYKTEIEAIGDTEICIRHIEIDKTKRETTGDRQDIHRDMFKTETYRWI